MNDKKNEIDKINFKIKKAHKIAELIFKYHEYAKCYDFCDMAQCLIQAKTIASEVFIPSGGYPSGKINE